jgi:hypothetical protein
VRVGEMVLVIYMFLGFRKVEEEVDILWKEAKGK